MAENVPCTASRLSWTSSRLFDGRGTTGTARSVARIRPASESALNFSSVLRASSRASSSRDLRPSVCAMLAETSRTIIPETGAGTTPELPTGAQIAGLAKRMTKKATTSARKIKRTRSRIWRRRWFLRTLSSRNCIAAQRIGRGFPRLSRWMTTGTPTAGRAAKSQGARNVIGCGPFGGGGRGSRRAPPRRGGSCRRGHSGRRSAPR